MADDPGAAQIITPPATPWRQARNLNPASTWQRRDQRDRPHQVANGDLTALAHVGPVNAPEFADVISTENRLKAPAEATGGSVRRLASSSALGGDVTLPSVVPVARR